MPKIWYVGRSKSKRSPMGKTRFSLVTKFPRFVWKYPVKFMDDTLFRELPKSRIQQAIQDATHSLAIENQYIPNGSEELLMKRMRREISQSEFLQEALKIAQSHRTQ